MSAFMIAGRAQATDVTETFTFSSTNFSAVWDPNSDAPAPPGPYIPPYNPFTGSITVTYDPTQTVLPTKSGLTINSLSILSTGSEFTYDPTYGALVVGNPTFLSQYGYHLDSSQSQYGLEFYGLNSSGLGGEYLGVNYTAGGDILFSSASGGVNTFTSSVENTQGLLASALGAWTSAIQSATTGPTPTQQLQEEEACIDNNSCNIDQVTAQNQALTEQRLGAVQNAAANSEGLVDATLPDPSNPFDVITALLTNGKSLFENAVSLIDLLSGHSTDTNKQVSISNITGSGYALTPTSNFYDLTATAQIADDELANLYVGESFLTDFQLADGQPVYGVATITSMVDPPGVGTLGLEFQEFTSSAVPEPEAWTLMLIGVSVVGGSARLRRRKRPQSSTGQLRYRTS